MLLRKAQNKKITFSKTSSKLGWNPTKILQVFEDRLCAHCAQEKCVYKKTSLCRLLFWCPKSWSSCLKQPFEHPGKVLRYLIPPSPHASLTWNLCHPSSSSRLIESASSHPCWSLWWSQARRSQSSPAPPVFFVVAFFWRFFWKILGDGFCFLARFWSWGGDFLDFFSGALLESFQGLRLFSPWKSTPKKKKLRTSPGKKEKKKP